MRWFSAPAPRLRWGRQPRRLPESSMPEARKTMSQGHPITVSAEHSKAERVYRELRRRIRGLELQPGSRLQKNEIALEFGVSRAPGSEAIARVAGGGGGGGGA